MCSAVEEKLPSNSRISSEIVDSICFKVREGKNPLTTTQSFSSRYSSWNL